jgi:hypothetical protein
MDLSSQPLGVEQTAEGPVLDMEILIPLDKEVDVPPRTYSKNYSISNMQSMHDMKEILNFFKRL